MRQTTGMMGGGKNFIKILRVLFQIQKKCATVSQQQTLPVSERMLAASVQIHSAAKRSPATAATRYPPRVCGREAGHPSGSISWMKTWPIIWAENRCFQQRALHHCGPVGNEGKYQGPGIYDVAF